MKTDTKHTPGPWHASGTKVFGLDAITSEQDHPRHLICMIPHAVDPKNNPDQVANARLIAAAPNLLEALQFMYEAVSEIRSEEWPVKGLGIGVSPSHLDALLRKAEAAIEKAQGT